MSKVVPSSGSWRQEAWRAGAVGTFECATTDASCQSIPRVSTRASTECATTSPSKSIPHVSARASTNPCLEASLTTSSTNPCLLGAMISSDSPTSLFQAGTSSKAAGLFFADRRAEALLSDPEALKDQIPENLANHQDDEKEFYSDSGFFQRLARNNGFVNVSLLTVVLSSIWIGVEVDGDESEVLFQVVAHSFCIFFVGELFVRLMAFRRKREIFSNPFLRLHFGFDAVLTLLVLVDTWIVPVLIVAANLQLDDNARFLLIFRLLRILRVLRVVRVVREVPELLLIIKGVMMAVRPIIVVMALIGLIIYAFAIVFRVALQGTEIGVKRFSSVPTSMATLLIEAILSGTKGGPVMREVHSESPFVAVILFVFVMVANITMMGVLGGLLVHTVRTVAEVEKEEHAVKDAMASFDALWQNFLSKHDGNGDGCISALELKVLFDDKKAKRILTQLQVDFGHLEEVSEFVFQEHGGELTRSQLQKMILDLRSKNTAKVKDHVVTRKFFQSELQKFGHRCGQEVS